MNAVNAIKKFPGILLLLFLPIILLPSYTTPVRNEDISETSFKAPARDYYPETWFHFIGGNVSKQGITADLEAIAAAGLSGIQLFHGSGNAWPGVTPQIQTLSKDWDNLVLWTAQECKRLGLRFTMQNCPGWSYAGGPWITPENAMRHLVRSRTDITGGSKKEIQLPAPQAGGEEWRNYKDLFVIAFPTPEGDTGKPLAARDVKSNRAGLPLNEFLKGQKELILKPSEGQTVSFDFYFGSTQTLRTLELPSINSFSHPWCYAPGVTVRVSAIKNGKEQQVAFVELPAANWQDDQPVSIACKEIPSDSYRIEIRNLHEMRLNYLRFYSAARQQNWESEAAWTLRNIVRADPPKQIPEAWVKSSRLVDITEFMDASGKLRWNAPVGNWTILRIGHVNTGMKNGPAPPEATGWEANKLDVSGARANFDGYIGRLTGDGGVLQNGLLKGILIDSWECKTQTWTSGLDDLFQKKWNYSLHTMFPALFGYVVDNPENTSRFLRDWRVTLNDLLVKNFFGEMKTLSGKNNLKISFETASGDVFPGDILEYYKYSDYPMCEFWQPEMDSFVGSIEFKPVRPAVSAAHVYGKKRVAAEAFTSFNLTWNEHPRFLKDVADNHFARGVTHLVFHTYTHNPRTDFLPPATSFGGGIGTPFNRLQTWWRHMPAFTTYLARCNYMLEAGRPVSDVLMYLGDEQNHKPPQSLSLPPGYEYDYCNADVLLNRLTFRNGKLMTPEGLSYKVLWLYDCKRMLPETLEKIAGFVEKGLVLVGEAPVALATLSGGDNAEARLKRAIKKLWGNSNEGVCKVGKGSVYNTTPEAALRAEKILPDVSFKSSKLRWLHRQTDASDIYFISAPADQGHKGTVSFRSIGNVEIWDPLTGGILTTKTAPRNEITDVELDLPAGSSCFVVFRKMKSKDAITISPATLTTQVNGPWNIQFPAGWGIDAPVKAVELKAWKELPLTPEGKSFSGTATYRTTFHLKEKQKGRRYLLDLGKVEVIAKVSLNGKNTGTRWTYPYVFDITESLTTGTNELEAEVTGTWFNRLVYDAGLPEKERKTWTIAGPEPENHLKESGLLGPVSIKSELK